MRKIFIILAVSTILALIFIITSQNIGYDIKITIKSPNMSAVKTDLEAAKNVKDKLAQIEKIKDIVIFSYPNYCSIYLKLSPSLFKAQTFAKIQNALLNYNYEIDYDYKKPYDTFLIITSNDYKNLKKLTDYAFDELLNLNITKHVANLGERQNAIYINFNTDILAQYNLSIEDIKKAFEHQNVVQDCIIKVKDNSYTITSNSSVSSIDDIKNMTLYFKNDSFSYKFKDIFEIEEQEYEPLDCYINYDDKKAQVLALKKKSFYPYFIYKLKLKRLEKSLNKSFGSNFKLINPEKYSKTVVYLNNQASILKTEKTARELFEKLKQQKALDNLIFTGMDSVKLKYDNNFYEFEKNKITVFSKNKKLVKKTAENLNLKVFHNKEKELYASDLDTLYGNIEKENYINSLTKKSFQINFNFDDWSLNDYFSTKDEILDYLNTRYLGLLISNFFDKYEKTPVILKNTDEDIYIYSKKFKNLLNIDSFIKPNVQKDFDVIVRKNKFYYTKLYK